MWGSVFFTLGVVRGRVGMALMVSGRRNLVEFCVYRRVGRFRLVIYMD